MTQINNTILLLLFIFSIKIFSQSLTFYIDPVNGNDSNNGTINQPYATVSKALTVVAAGDTIFLRNGTYSLSSTLSLSKIGTSNNYFHFFAYPGERPVFDFSKQTSSDGIKMNGNYWHLKGIESTYSAHNGIAVNGS